MLLAVTLTASSLPAWADDTVIPAPTVAPLVKNQPAPFAGVLLSPQAVASIVAQKDTAAQAAQLAVQHQVDLDALQLKYTQAQMTTTCTADKQVLQAQIDDNKKQILVLEDQLKKNTGGPGAPVWIGLGAVGGIVLSVVTVFAVSRATK